MVKRIKSLVELRIFAKNVAKSLRGGEVLGLIGNLGTGKTTFSKMLLKELGVKKRVTSPTFVLMLPYATIRGNIRQIFHMDLYRLKDLEDVESLGIFQKIGLKENIFLIEWAEKIKKRLPKNTVYINFKIKGKDNYREITIKNVPRYFKI